MKKKILAMLIMAFMLVLTACGGGQGGSTQPPANQGGTEAPAQQPADEGKKTLKLGITQLLEHPSLDLSREGFLQGLADHGYVEGENLIVDYKNAQLDMGVNATIAQQLASGDYDLILAIATPSAQAVVQQIKDAGKDTPVFFTAITDPVEAGLIASMEDPGGNVTGTSDSHPDALPSTAKAMRQFFPDAKKVGIMYNPGEDNAVAEVNEIKGLLEAEGFEVVERSTPDTNSVTPAAQSLLGEVDVIYIPKDNTVISNLESIGSVAKENHVPIVAGEGDTVERAGGAFYAYGFKYVDLGYQTAEMALRVIEEGIAPQDVPAERPAVLDLYVNYANGQGQGIEDVNALLEKLPADLKQRIVEFGK